MPAKFKVATWNVNSLRVRLPQVLAWMRLCCPDVLAMQETKITDAEFPADDFQDAGYEIVHSGQKTYNGVAIASRGSPRRVLTDFPDFPDPQRRLIHVEIDDLCILNLYVPNGSEVGSDKYRYKLQWLSHLQDFVRTQLQRNACCIVLGDFNIAPKDEDVHDPKEWDGQVLCSGPERAEFIKLLDAGLTDCFRSFDQAEKSFTWWDYRAASFRRNRGLRIDHILAGPGLAGRCRACRIDREPRAWDRPSDHAPVIAEFER
ncbi:MAG: exodeoxyribonuclease III [Gammaproteobacteria bacterium]